MSIRATEAKRTEGYRKRSQTFLRSPVLVTLLALALAGAGIVMLASSASASHGEADLIRIAGEAPQYASLDEALAAADTGDTVIVPASPPNTTVHERDTSITVTDEDITICGSVGGAPICTSEIEAGHQQLSRAEWAEAPGNGSGEAVLFDDAGTDDHRSTSYFPPADTKLDDIDPFGFDYYLEQGTCDDLDVYGQLAIDATPGDNTSDRDELVRATPSLDNCEEGSWFHVNLMDADWSYASVGSGTFQDIVDEVNDNYPEGDYEISAVNVAQDDNVTVGYVDNQVIDGVVLGEEQDVNCSAAGQAPDDTLCRQETAVDRTVIDANDASAATVSIEADGATIQDLTLQNTGDAEDRYGVDVRADDATVANNVIEGNFAPEEHGTSTTLSPTINQIGVRINAGAQDTAVEGNSIESWRNIGIYVGGSAGDGVSLVGNDLTDNRWHGILLEGPNADGAADEGILEVRDNDIAFSEYSAIRFGVEDASNFVIRGNDLALSNQFGVTVQDRVEDATFDVRWNQWGVVKEEVIEETRIDDNGTDNEIEVNPYLNADGEQIPPEPEVQCYVTEDGNTSRTTVGQAGNIQRAVELGLPSDCEDADEDGTVERIIVLEESFEEYDGATIDTQVRIESATTQAVQGSTQGAFDFGARIHAQQGEPALHFVEGSQGSEVQGLGLQGEPVGTTAILAEDIDGDSRISIEDVGIGSRNHDATQNVVARNVEGLSLTSSTILSGDPIVHLDGTSDTTIDDNTLVSRAPANPGGPDDEARGILVEDADGPTIANNVVVGNGVEGSVAIDVSDTSEPLIDDNILVDVVEGLVLEASTDAVVEDNSFTFPTLNLLGPDNVAINLTDGADHVLERNTIQFADIGLNIDGTSGVEGDLNRFNATTTGVHVTELSGVEDVDDLVLNNGTKAATLDPLVLTGSTQDLDVDAECNDWGVYHYDLVRARIADSGDDNDVDAQPFTSPNTDSGQVECLTPPEADFSFAPTSPVTRLDEVEFTDESEAGSWDITDYSWDFGDGTTSTEQNPSHSFDSVNEEGFFVELTVHDQVNMSSSKVHKIVVENLEPTLDLSDEAITIEHNDALSFTATAEDPEGDDLSFSAELASEGEQLPSEAGLEDNGDGTATFSWDPTPDQYGTYEVVVTVSDGFDEVSETVEVEIVNQPPAFEPELPAFVGGVVDRALTVDVSAVDPDAGDTVSDVSANLSELPGDATFTQHDASSGTLTWTPDAGDEGNYTVNFTADSPARSVTESVNLGIRSENFPPDIFNIAGDTVVLDGDTAELVAEASDQENDDINWSVETTPETPGDSLTVNEQEDQAKWTWDVPTNDSGTYEVTFLADDGYGIASEATQTISIEASPYLDALLPKETETGKFTTRPMSGSTIEVAYWAADPDGTLGASDFDIEVDDGDSVTTLDAPSLQDPSATEPRLWVTTYDIPSPGTYDVTVNATDADGNHEEVEFTFIAEANAPPDVSVDAHEIWRNATSPNGAEVTLSGDAVDPEGRLLGEDAFEWTIDGTLTLPGSEVDPTLSVGTHTAQLEVTDPFGESDQETVLVHVDDEIAADAELDAPEDNGTYQVDPVQHALEDLEGQVTVKDDLATGVEDAFVTGTVVYHGVEANEQSVAVASFNNTTDSEGVAEFSYEQDILGALGEEGVSILSAPGMHEINLTVTAPSRAGAPHDGQEIVHETITYWVGPQVPPEPPDPSEGEAGAHASAACYDAPASEEDRNGSADEARLGIFGGAPVVQTPGPENVTEGAQTFADQGADCHRGFGQASVLVLGTLVQACYDSELHVQMEADCPTQDEGLFLPPELPGMPPESPGGDGLSQALAAGLEAEGACFYGGNGSEDGSHVRYQQGDGLDTNRPDQGAASAALTACANGLTNGTLPQGGSFLAVTGTAGDQALVVTVNTVPASDVATGQSDPGPTGITGQAACHYEDQGAEDRGEVFLGPPPPEPSAPDAGNVTEALSACVAAAGAGSLPDGGSHARFQATVAGSVVAVSADTVPLSAALT